MCEAHAYLRQKTGKKKLLMENVYRLQPEGSDFLLENIFGEQLLLALELEKISLMEHQIIFRPR